MFLSATFLKFSLLTVMTSSLLNGCSTLGSDESLSTNPNIGSGDRWQFTQCKNPQPSELPTDDSPFQMQVYRKVTATPEGALDLVFTNENGEEYKLALSKPSSVEPGKTSWWGKAELTNAVALDNKPMILGYVRHTDAQGVVTGEFIFTKTEVPGEYLEDGDKVAYEINRYGPAHDAVTAVVMQEGASAGYAFTVSRACGQAFGFKPTNERTAAGGGEFKEELSVRF